MNDQWFELEKTKHNLNFEANSTHDSLVALLWIRAIAIVSAILLPLGTALSVGPLVFSKIGKTLLSGNQVADTIVSWVTWNRVVGVTIVEIIVLIVIGYCVYEIPKQRNKFNQLNKDLTELQAKD